jgi:hypothetical protein
MLTDDEIVLGGYRFEDLQALRIIENRTDLNRKQNELGFPKPIKTGKSQAWFPKSEVHAWLRQRAALRDVQIQGDTPTPSDVTIRPIRKPPPDKAKKPAKKSGRAATDVHV